ncbi:MAG: bifunctional 3-demethylubiquinol 3-O-methyltransferase/2-polyprenyl-6-hydroxyphenol methylase [Rickettsiales bacterium]|nr:bifunctional 3-demethylubiquinol 3-O-methyltransferase/2-polyprenyl-6-hydroxyphenol methylase [Rickettsiales bacterium]|tara:strand:+ start:44011 stop:44733 length:723 start_codon:yes stop_codon:yes gene_type:complete
MRVKKHKEEIEFFDSIKSWWGANGEMDMLHQMNQLRLEFILNKINTHFVELPNDNKSCHLSVLDVGCGGGVASEPMARIGYEVTGVDGSLEAIKTASEHAKAMGLSIEYMSQKIETLNLKRKFDIILALEVVEHVDDLDSFVKILRQHLKSNGIVFISTINQTTKSYFMSILMAEYILGIVPKKTHDWQKFIKPSRLYGSLENEGLVPLNMSGMVYNPLFQKWTLKPDISNNYILCAKIE